MSATDAPGFNVSSTICRRSNFDRNCLVRPFFNVTTIGALTVVPIVPPVGHDYGQLEE
jgi:hypothetical protein